MKLNRVFPFVMLVVLLAGVLAGCTAAKPAGGTLIIAMNLDDVVTLDPAWAGETTNLFIHINTYDTLVDIRPDDLNTIVPRLAESWDINADFTEFVFHLRKDAKFASGNPVTAQDVVFSWNRLLNVAGPPAFNLDGVGKVEAVDDYTVKVSTAVGDDGLPQSLPQFLSSACNPSLGIQDSKLVKEHGGTDAADAATTDKAKEWLDQNSAGSGPFIMTRWSPKADIELVANKNYWKGAPKFDKVVISHVSDPTTQLQMLEKGDADMLGNLQTDLVEQAKANPDIAISVDQSLDENYLAMAYVCPDAIKAADPAKFAELQSPDSFAIICKKEVRQAVAYAIDYEGIAKAVLNGYAARAPSIIPIGILGVDPSKTQGRDLAKAKELLTAAGYPDGVTFDLYYASNATRDTVAAKIKNDLAEAGITLNLKPLEQSVYLTQMRAQQLPMAFGGWTPDYLDVTMWTDYFGLGDRSIAFRMRFQNEEANKLATEIRTTADPAARKAAVEKLQAVFIEEMPFTMLYQTQYVHAFRTDLKGFKFHPVWFVDLFELSK
jgi:peptide/nickel transport system substrate-binding protein